MSLLLVEPGTPGLAISRDLPKIGYKGVESCELSFVDMRVPVGTSSAVSPVTASPR